MTSFAVPSYYLTPGGLQPFDVIDAWGLDFYAGNVIKYLLRHKGKNGTQDLRKALHYVSELRKRALEDELHLHAQGGGPCSVTGLRPVISRPYCPDPEHLSLARVAEEFRLGETEREAVRVILSWRVTGDLDLASALIGAIIADVAS